MIQDMLGTVISEQGTRIGSEAGIQLLGLSVDTYKSALTVFTRETFPQDWVMSSSNLAEALFLSERFSNARDQVAMLLNDTIPTPKVKIPLLIISIASTIGLGENKKAYEDFEMLSRTINQQGQEFTLSWSWTSINTAIVEHPVFSRHQQWLLELINTFGSGRRDELLVATDTARKAFESISRP